MKLPRGAGTGNLAKIHALQRERAGGQCQVIFRQPEMRDLTAFISGSTGFVGIATVRAFAKAGVHVRAGMRASHRDVRTIPSADEVTSHADLEHESGWPQILNGCNVVVHIAGPAHLDLGPAEIAPAQRAIIDGTKNLAAGAARAGVKRFVYLSSAHVFGSQSSSRHPFREVDETHPQSHYTIAKQQAEQEVVRTATGSGMDYVIVRPPMVYGPGAPGNFSRLLRLVHSSWPLPLAGAQALRSFIGIDNLAAALLVAAECPAASNDVFNISDGDDCSTAQMIHLIAQAQARRPRLFWAPQSLLLTGAHLMGKRADFDKIFQPFQIDISHFRNVTGWRPPLSLREGICEASKRAPGSQPVGA